MPLNIAVIGNGGREHALAWKLEQSPLVFRVFIIPGNGGTQRDALRDNYRTELSEKIQNVPIQISDYESMSEWLLEHQTDFVIIGPEVPLADGIVNYLYPLGIKCFGPTAEAALIESDKCWAKFFMSRWHIPTADWETFNHADDAKYYIRSNPNHTVVKAAGLAAGKGVIVAQNVEEACQAVDDIMTSSKFGDAGQVVVIEERLDGEEISVMAFTDGKAIKTMLPVQDHKRLLNSDRGPNTGGMGAYCPYVLSDTEMKYVQEKILQKTIDALAFEDIRFVGVLYAGLMITSSGIKVLEFNCRFGDPETQVLMPLLDVDLVEIIEACCSGTLNKCNIPWKENLSCVAVVMASEGYPENPLIGREISGLSTVADVPDLHVFHAATGVKDDTLVTTGGRVLNVVAVAESLPKASAKATAACRKIDFVGRQYRTDIAYKGILRHILAQGATTYQSAGVDISSGDQFIRDMRPLIETTFNEDVVSPIGSFGAIVDAKFAEYSYPLLVSGCDGVGTKLKVAQQCNNYSTIGQDLVAMCVNDILAHGAKPLFFLDYFACGKLEKNRMAHVITSIIEGCKLAGCALVGGETAEMPGFYQNDEYDLAGFAVGVVEKSKLLPSDQIAEGDKIIYLPSSGIHSNGFSLVRKIIADLELSYSDNAPFSVEGLTLGEEFLKPTTIYVSDILPLVEENKIKAFAHITGGGLPENVCRVIPRHLKVNLNASEWNILPVFAWIAAVGEVSEAEMLRTFNCGVGAVVIVAPENADKVSQQLQSNVIGEVMSRNEGYSQVNIINFSQEMSKLMTSYIPSLLQVYETPVKRVAVLISGTGSNLKALINATRTDRMSAARIALVVSSKQNAEGLNYAIQHDIHNMVLERGGKIPVLASDQRLHDVLINENIEIVCLAGFMHILSEWFVKQWRGKMLNVHPSLLPSFKGMHAQRQALKAGVRVSGCTVHFVEPEVDAGAIIEQASVSIYPEDTEATLINKIKEQEHVIFPKALKLLATEKIALDLDTGKVIWK